MTLIRKLNVDVKTGKETYSMADVQLPVYVAPPAAPDIAQLARDISEIKKKLNM